MSRNPDIQKLLANLRGGAAYQQEQEPTPDSVATVAPGNTAASRRNDVVAPHWRDETRTPVKPDSKPAAASAQRSNSEQPSNSAAPDPSLITTWPAAIRFVSKYIATNGVLEAKVKRLISDQHRHEREWWAKREAIINRHASRAGNQEKAAELLRSLGGQYVPVAPTDPETDGAELEAFDMKVHKSLTQLATHYDRELKQMGIPFFTIKHNLVILEDGRERDAAQKGRLDRGELRQLQSRMLTHLEELFGEE